MSKWRFPQYATMTFIAMLLLAGCVSQQKYDASQQRYDALDAEYQQLNQTISAEVATNQSRSRDFKTPLRSRSTVSCCFPRAAGKCRLKHSRPSAKSFRS